MKQPMNIFTEINREDKPTDWKDDILKSISYSGTASVTESIKIVIAERKHLSNIIDLSNGSARLSRSTVKKFSLILSQPTLLSAFKPTEIRCSLCQRLIKYPCWYYSIKYAVNHFHYFVCFDSSSSDKPSTKCYRRL